MMVCAIFQVLVLVYIEIALKKEKENSFFLIKIFSLKNNKKKKKRRRRRRNVVFYILH